MPIKDLKGPKHNSDDEALCFRVLVRHLPELDWWSRWGKGGEPQPEQRPAPGPRGPAPAGAAPED